MGLQMKRKSLHYNLSRKYCLSISFLNFIRRYKDGLTCFELSMNFDWFKADHNPQFSLSLILFNVMVIEVCIYNKNHVNKRIDEVDEWEKCL